MSLGGSIYSAQQGQIFYRHEPRTGDLFPEKPGACICAIPLPVSEERSRGREACYEFVAQEDDFGVVLKAISKIDVGKAEAQEEADRIRILKVIEEKVGTSDLNRIVIGSLQVWLADTAKHQLMSLQQPERKRSLLPYWLGCLLQQQGKLAEARSELIDLHDHTRRN